MNPLEVILQLSATIMRLSCLAMRLHNEEFLDRLLCHLHQKTQLPLVGNSGWESSVNIINFLDHRKENAYALEAHIPFTSYLHLHHISLDIVLVQTVIVAVFIIIDHSRTFLEAVSYYIIVK